MGVFDRLYYGERLKFRGIISGLTVVVLLFLFINREDTLRNPVSERSGRFAHHRWWLKGGIFRRIIIEETVNSSNYDQGPNGFLANSLNANRNPTICTGLHEHKGYNSKCEYVRANPQCNSEGFFNYLVFFYCDCGKYRVLAYLVLAIWLISLFYLLGNTAADYFCCSLEKLSSLLRLPPTLAGVTLLPLGNGAPDVFASIASFVGSDSGDVGLNSVLGGAVFVTCIVVGTVSLCVAERNIRLDTVCFVRDICFFLLALLYLLVILIVGEVSLGGAIAFVSIYLVYALCVAANEILRNHARRFKLDAFPLLPVTESIVSNENGEDESIRAPFLEANSTDGVPQLEPKLPHWMWASNVAIYSNEVVKTSSAESPKSLWGWSEEDVINKQSSFSCSTLCSMLEIPLTIPRRLTIPIIEEQRWSKSYAVASASFAPMLLAFLWNTQDDMGFLGRDIAYVIGATVGAVLGILSLIYTRADGPPQKFLFPWVLGGFFMSIIWFYIVANELVALLVAFGVILGIKPSLLALTILAWGNSMGDLMSNVALAVHGGDSVQIAMSGCYAGPMFNTIAGLGISMLLRVWSNQPATYIVPKESSLYYTLGFLLLGLIWSLIVLPRSGMRPNKLLGMGLMTIYLVFLSVRASIAMGDGSLNGHS